MSVLVIGTVAFDSVKTPFGTAKDVLGGSAAYFATSASFFTDVRLVAVIGKDFPDEHVEFLKSRGIGTEGLVRTDGDTFRWSGEYGFDLNEAHTLETHLNVLETFKPEVPEDWRDSDIVFLANIDPDLQREVIEQVRDPKLIACDTMNFWIDGKNDALKRTLGMVDLVVINEGEARELAGESNLVKAAAKILDLGPTTLIIKRGEYGALLFHAGQIFSAPAYPLEDVFDPTGAGDTFAGGFIGHIGRMMDKDWTQHMRQAVVYGSVMASYNVEDFSLDRMRRLKEDEIEARYREFKELTHFEHL